MNSTPCLRCTARLLFKRRSSPQSALNTRDRRKYTRPSFAPKPILDVKHIAQNPGLYAQNCIDRNYAHLAQNAWRIVELRQAAAILKRNATADRTAIRGIEKEISGIKSGNHSDAAQVARIEELIGAAAEVRARLAQADEDERRTEAEVLPLALALPNLSSIHTPAGAEPHPVAAAEPSAALRAQTKSHVEIGVDAGILDFASAATTSGWGWYFLRNEAAQLEAALVAHALAALRQAGWAILAPPSVVHAHIAAACGFAPRDASGETQIYELAAGPDEPRLVLAGTAEIPLAGMQAERALPFSSLPLRTAGVSRSFRAEAGARGADTKGLYRVHEFTKVEMFAWTAPAASDTETEAGGEHFEAAAAPSPQQAMLQEMLGLQRRILDPLDLTLRTLEMPAADLGASAARKVDLEAFFPSRQARGGGWGELASASLCGTYQSRRLGTRVKMADGRLAFPGTANATALAVPRVLAALLETGLQGSGRVRIPECLRGYMDGMEYIEPRKA